jgi:outer membrane protein TolC
MLLRYIGVYVLVFMHILLLKGTISAQGKSDTLFLIEDFVSTVKMYHPLAKQAQLQGLKADAQSLKARGGFDPKISTSLEQKYYDDKSYFSLFQGGLSVPTWIGADIKAGYQDNAGTFLNNENFLPSNGLFYAGISVPLGRGLLIDERRAEVLSADINQVLAGAQERNMLNDLLFVSISVYWDWFKSFHIKSVYQASMDAANQRYLAVVNNTASGDKPGIDTIEAKIQLQIITQGYIKSLNDFKNSSLFLSGLIWNNSENSGLNVGLRPSEISQEIEKTNTEIFNLTPDGNRQNHPYIDQLSNKIRQLELEKRLKQDKLKPSINLQYNPLVEPIGADIISNFNINNYKWGVNFQMPLFLRKERGDIKLAQLKIEETNLELQNKTVELQNKAMSYVNEWQASNEQIQIFEETVELYDRMLAAERRLFDIGESSLFLVNSREQSLINAKIKLIELIAKNKISYYAIQYFAGRLAEL